MKKKVNYEAMPEVTRIPIIWMVLLVGFLFMNADVYGQGTQITVTGTVTEEDGSPLPGANIIVAGDTRGVSTDTEGTYSIDVSPSAQLRVTFIGMEEQIIDVEGREVIDVVMQQKTSELEGLTVVAFGTQEKESVLSSVESIEPVQLQSASSNLTTALAGKIPGLISYQRTGEPGEDNAEFFIRGVTTFGYAAQPLILIDGLESTANDLANMNPDNIASFSVMKDASASALYGSRAANGVISVTTKEGVEGKAQISVRYEKSVSSPTQQVNLADPITYMELHNEAVTTRDRLGVPPYSREKVASTEQDLNPLLYPATDWYDMLFKQYAVNDRLNFNVSGGGDVARYFIGGSYNQDNGVLEVDPRNDFNSNIDLKKYLLRSNIDIDITGTTELSTKIVGSFDDYRGPVDGGAALYRKVMQTNPVLFPPTYQPTESLAGTQHILFGNYQNGGYINPYADMIRGYREFTRAKMSAQFELDQDLSFITEGLELRGLFSTERFSFYSVTRAYNPFYYSLGTYNDADNTYTLTAINPTTGQEFLDYNEGGKDVTSATYLEAAINYQTSIGARHNMSAMIVSYLRNELQANAGSLQESLPFRNLGISGRLTYNYDSRYFIEGNFGYNGSERFSKQHQFGLFPSIAAGWLVSNELFWSGNLPNIIPFLRLKASYGLIGNDQIGPPSDRFFYLSQVNIGDGSKGYGFGTQYNNFKSGTTINRYANPRISWETAEMLNLSMEFNLFDMMDFQVEVYKEHRTNILMDRAHITSVMGLQTVPRANVGEAKGRGIDASLDIQKSFRNGYIVGRFNLTYATSEYVAYEEPGFVNSPWKSRIGYPIGQRWGYIAERLFVDEEEVENSPTQFGDAMAGDIKYKDINGDGVISDLDQVPIGYPTTPEITFGFGLSAGYKGLDFSFFFQGLARESFWIDTQNTAPFVDTNSGSVNSQNQLLEVYANSHWSENNRDLYAIWPRLSNEIVTNNNQISTWFMRNGSFLRLKSVELGYSLPDRLISKLDLTNVRPYISGTNLLTFSAFKLWDPEMAGNGLGYPIQRVFNVGLQVSF